MTKFKQWCYLPSMQGAIMEPMCTYPNQKYHLLKNKIILKQVGIQSWPK